MQTLCMIWGILALIGMFVGLVPCLGWANWLNIPFAIVGLIISLVSIFKVQPGQSKTGSVIGIVCCGIAFLFGGIRLLLGGGIF